MSYTNLPESKLISLAKQGDEGAATELLSRYEPLFQRLINQYFVDGLDKDDLYQEIRLAVWHAIADYDPQKAPSFAPLAQTVATNTILDKIRQANTAKQQAFNKALSYDDGLSYEAEANFREKDFLSSAELEQELHRLDIKLSDLEQKALVARLQGLSYQEIATDLGVKSKTIDNALQRVKRKFTKALKEKG